MSILSNLLTLSSIYGLPRIENDTLSINGNLVLIVGNNAIYQISQRYEHDITIKGDLFKTHQLDHDLTYLHGIIRNGLSAISSINKES